LAPIINRLGRQRDAEVYYGSRSKPTTLRGILLNLASFSGIDDQTSFATLLQGELPAINGYARATLGAPDSSAYNGTLGGWQLKFDRSFSASGADLDYNAIALCPDAASVANLVATGGVNPSTNQVTVNAHGLTDGTRVTLTVDTGGTYPTNGNSVTGATLLYAKNISVNVLELYTDSGLTTIVDWTSAGSGAMRLRNASGDWDILTTLDVPQTITSGSSKTISFDPIWLK